MFLVGLIYVHEQCCKDKQGRCLVLVIIVNADPSSIAEGQIAPSQKLEATQKKWYRERGGDQDLSILCNL